jgi:cardiolipin synthase
MQITLYQPGPSPMAAKAAPAKPPAASAGLSLYIEGDELYSAMLAAIGHARRSIKLESYIFADDEIGQRFIAALGERARAGVQVLVHLDAAGSLFLGPRSVQRALTRHGARVRWFHRWSWRSPLRYNHRNHRKLLVVDGRVGFLGGFNIHRENSREIYGEARWRDTHIQVDGVLARDLQVLFNAFWRGRRRSRPDMVAPGGHTLITNHSRYGRLFLRDLYTAKFAAARKHIYLTTPYFVPDYRTQAGLKRAAKRGVDVRILVPHKSNQHLAQWAAHAAYANLLAAGVQIYQYLPRMQHAKTAVVDDAWSIVGTANLDYRSFFLNYELNLASTQPALARELERQFMDDLAESEQIQPRRWARRGWLLRGLELVGWAARRWL